MNRHTQIENLGYLKWPNLIRGTLIKRYKRFMADIKLRNGHVVTSRRLKHLVELQQQVRLGDRSVMFFLVQRMDAKVFKPADHITTGILKDD